MVGVAPALASERADFLSRWLALGFAADMSYMGRNQDKRTHPRLLVPGARSVISLGLPYASPPHPLPPLHGRVAAYARHTDYHQQIKDKLRELWTFILSRAGEHVRGRYYVDTGPVLERELAQRAGLGWVGKNTCLINRRQGSFFFLAEIITDLPLVYDTPATDHCGTCTRCLDACPTGALTEPYLLDARRCLSYLTIELKGPIPMELRPALGQWIFGCDICQNVCPWNRRVLRHLEIAPQEQQSLAVTSPTDVHSLGELLGLDQESFSRRFRGSPIKRAKRRGLLRNVAVALGNSGSAAAVPALLRALQDSEPLVRAHAAWALGRLGGATARAGLQSTWEQEQDPQVRAELVLALQRFPAGQ